MPNNVYDPHCQPKNIYPIKKNGRRIRTRVDDYEMYCTKQIFGGDLVKRMDR